MSTLLGNVRSRSVTFSAPDDRHALFDGDHFVFASIDGMPIAQAGFEAEPTADAPVNPAAFIEDGAATILSGSVSDSAHLQLADAPSESSSSTAAANAGSGVTSSLGFGENSVAIPIIGQPKTVQQDPVQPAISLANAVPSTHVVDPTPSGPPLSVPQSFAGATSDLSYSSSAYTGLDGLVADDLVSLPSDPQFFPSTHLNTTQAGQQITRDNYHWGSTLGSAAGPITFGFRTSAPGYTVTGEDVQGTFSVFTAAEQTSARAALSLWATLANITFTDLGNSNSATIEFGNYYSSSDNSEAFAFYPGSTSASASAGDVFMNTYYASTSNVGPGTYEWMTLIHEIGHAIGLEHPGNYNAGPGQVITYANSAQYVEDTRQYSLMSYFGETNTGGSYTVYDETPMLDDIAAIQRLYGANTNTFTGNTTFGFNSNAGSPYNIAAASQHVVFTVYDRGGTDTFDFSGYSQAQTINLNAESFSSVGGDVYNVSIAQGITIENAIGGSGADTIIGNSANNTFTGNGGNDSISGGAGSDVAIYTGARSGYYIANYHGADGLVHTYIADQGGNGAGSDDLVSVEGLTIGGVAYSNIGANLTHQSNISGSRFDDVLFQDASTGATLVAKMSGGNVISYSNPVSNLGSGWSIVGSGNIMSNGVSDIVLQQSNGQIVYADETGGQFNRFVYVANSGAFQVKGVGDINGDAYSDLVLQQNDGQIVFADMSGGQFQGYRFVTSVPGWNVVGVGDINRDGFSDIALQRQSDGQTVYANMANGNFNGFVYVANAGGFMVKAVSDLNGDGYADIVFQNNNSSGGNVFADMHTGTTQFGTAAPGFGSADWQIRSDGDVNNDGYNDLIVQQQSTGVAIELIQGPNGFDHFGTVFGGLQGWLIV